MMLGMSYGKCKVRNRIYINQSKRAVFIGVCGLVKYLTLGQPTVGVFWFIQLDGEDRGIWRLDGLICDAWDIIWDMYRQKHNLCLQE